MPTRALSRPPPSDSELLSWRCTFVAEKSLWDFAIIRTEEQNRGAAATAALDSFCNASVGVILPQHCIFFRNYFKIFNKEFMARIGGRYRATGLSLEVARIALLRGKVHRRASLLEAELERTVRRRVEFRAICGVWWLASNDRER